MEHLLNCKETTCFSNVTRANAITFECGGTNDVLSDFNVSFGYQQTCGVDNALASGRTRAVKLLGNTTTTSAPEMCFAAEKVRCGVPVCAMLLF